MSHGRHTATAVELAQLPSGLPVETTVHRYEGATDGPLVYVQAAQHGREVNGTETLRRFHDAVPLDALAGTVIAVPVADPLTFDHASYVTPEPLDRANSNMNRVWPGSETGTLHERMAARLWEFVEGADAVIDLHTSFPDTLSHVLYHEGVPEARDIARAFGTDLLLAEQIPDDDLDWYRWGFDGKLRVTATQEGIPAITPELAHNSQIVESAVETGVEGVLDVLRQLDMLPGSVTHRSGTVARNYRSRVMASESGLFRANPDLELGSTVAAGTHVGTLYDPTTYDPLQEATLDHGGILYTLRRDSIVTAGNQLAGVALDRE
jgi:predicted deacylase